MKVTIINGPVKTTTTVSDTPEVVGDETIYTVPVTTVPPIDPPIDPPTGCEFEPNSVFLPNSQQDFVHFTAGETKSYLVPLDSYKCAVTKNTETPDTAKFSCWFSRCPMVRDDLSASLYGSTEFNKNGGPCSFTRNVHTPPRTGYCYIPTEVAYWNVTCAVASGAVISRTGPAI